MEVSCTCLISRKTSMQFGLWVQLETTIYLAHTHLEMHQEHQSIFDLWYVEKRNAFGLKKPFLKTFRRNV